MNMGVSQDSGRLREIATEIEDMANTFKGHTDFITDQLKESIGAEENEQTCWYGPNAAAFLENYDKKCPAEFELAYNNIISMAGNLESQAESWEKFEQTGV